METRIWTQGDTPLIAHEEVSHMPFRWVIGLEGSRFFYEIEKRTVLLGIKCPSCKKVYVPQRQVCGPCFVRMSEFVELGNEGIIDGLTVVNYPFIDPDTGKRRPVPYTYGYIKLDGADNLFSHIIRNPKGGVAKVGDRVRAIFTERKHGMIDDIAYFEPVL